MRKLLKNFKSSMSLGFTIVEVVIAMTVIGIVSMAATTVIVQTRSNGTKYVINSNARNDASNIIEVFKASSDAEEFKAYCNPNIGLSPFEIWIVEAEPFEGASYSNLTGGSYSIVLGEGYTIYLNYAFDLDGKDILYLWCNDANDVHMFNYKYVKGAN